MIHCLQPILPLLTRVWRGDGFITVANGSIRKIDYKLGPLFRLNGRQVSLLAVEELARERFEERGYVLVRIGKAPKRAVLLRTDTPFPKIVRNGPNRARR